MIGSPAARASVAAPTSTATKTMMRRTRAIRGTLSEYDRAMAITAGTLVALRFDRDANVLRALDQTALPWREHELELRSAAEVAQAIKRLAIRGAPLIGVAAAYGLALEVARDPS